MKKAEDKTNAVRLLEQKRLTFTLHTYAPDRALSGQEVAAVLGQDPETVFKTLVTVGRSGGHYVFMVPVCHELDLKIAAAAVGEKSIAMIKDKELLPLTGYIHGGCSPIGMKKAFPTVIDETAQLFDAILFSGGRIGLQVEMSVGELAGALSFKLADITG